MNGNILYFWIDKRQLVCFSAKKWNNKKEDKKIFRIIYLIIEWFDVMAFLLFFLANVARR